MSIRFGSLGPSLLVLASCALPLLGACAGAKPAEAQAAQVTAHGGHHEGGHGMGDMCPLAIDGTTVAGEETADGAALSFTTTGDVAALRTRVAAMAKMHDEKHAAGAMHGAEHVPAAAARVEETATGARLVLVPNDAADLAALRAHVSGHAERMAKGECPMKHDGAAHTK